MSEHPIQLKITGIDSLADAIDRDDPRTPEHRARQRRELLREEAWTRLPFAAAANIALILVLLAVGLYPRCGAAPIVLTGLAGVLALFPLARISSLGPSMQWRIVLAEALASALGMAALASLTLWTTVLVASLALVGGACARSGAASWIHLLILGCAAVYFSGSMSAWATLAVLGVVAWSAALSLRQSRDALRRTRQAMELTELNALCTVLAANTGSAASGTQGAP